MTIALDIGTSSLRSLRRRGERLIGRNCRALYAVLPDSSQRRSVLDQLAVSYSVSENNLILTCDAAADYSRLFQVPCLRLLPEGRLPANNPPARQIVSWLIDRLLPEPADSQTVCCLTLPGPKRSDSFTSLPQSELLTHLVRLRGYRPVILNPARAALFAELGSESFTGIVICFGAGTTEMVLGRQGVEVASHTVSIGGDWLDQALAEADPQFAGDASGNDGLYLDDVTLWKETFGRSILHPRTDREAFLADCYRDMIEQVLEEVQQALLTSPLALSLPHPISLILCGGTARVRGFGNLFQQVLADTSFPVRVKKVRLVTDSDYIVARGCLIAAELEQRAALDERRAA